jgi:hypothetical protein
VKNLVFGGGDSDLRAADESTHARDELVGVDRLGEVVVTTRTLPQSIPAP